MNTLADLKLDLTLINPSSQIVIDITPDKTLALQAGDLQGALGVQYQPPAAVAYQARVNATQGLRLRSMALTSASIMEVMPLGTVVDVLNVPSVSGWLNVRAPDGKIGYSAAQYLDKVLPATPAPPAPTPAPKNTQLIGLHFLEDAQSQASQVIVSGAPLAGATVVDSLTIANYLSDHGVPYVLFRRWPDNQNLQIPADPTTSEAYGVQHVIDRVKADPALAQGHENVFIDIVNEVTWGPGHPNFWLGVLKQLTAMKLRGAFGCYGIGYPEPAQWSTAIPALEFAKANGHVVCLHSYCAPNTPLDQLSADSADYELRFVRLYAAVPTSAQPPLVIGECGHQFSNGTFEGTDHLIKFAQLFQTAIRGYSYVKSFNLWTVGSAGGWSASDISSALPSLETFIETERL